MRAKTTIKKTRKKRIGRGGTRGGKSGRGDKGQKSRAGRRIRPAIRDEMQRIPKRRGHNKNRARGVRGKTPARSVTLGMVGRNFEKDSVVTPTALVEKNIIARQGGKAPKVKIVDRGEIGVPVRVSGCAVSAGAGEKIRSAGGTIK